MVSSTCDQRVSFCQLFAEVPAVHTDGFVDWFDVLQLLRKRFSQRIHLSFPNEKSEKSEKISPPGPFRDVHFVFSPCFSRRKHVMRNSQLLPVPSTNFSRWEVEERCVAWQCFAFLWTSQVGSTAEAE